MYNSAHYTETTGFLWLHFVEMIHNNTTYLTAQQRTRWVKLENWLAFFDLAYHSNTSHKGIVIYPTLNRCKTCNIFKGRIIIRDRFRKLKLLKARETILIYAWNSVFQLNFVSTRIAFLVSLYVYVNFTACTEWQVQCKLILRKLFLLVSIYFHLMCLMSIDNKKTEIYIWIVLNNF